MARSVTRTLKEAAREGDKSVTEITLSYKLKYLRGHSLSAGRTKEGGEAMQFDVGSFIDIAAKMIGYTPDFLDELCEEDQQFVLGEARDFFINSLGAGKSESQ